MVVRSLFYFSLNDTYLQQEINNIKEDASLEKFYSEACVAESKRKSFQQIGLSSSQLDSSSGVSVSRWDTGPYNKGFQRKPEKSAVKSEQSYKKEQQQSPPCSNLARSSISSSSRNNTVVSERRKSVKFATNLDTGLLTAIVTRQNSKVVAISIVPSLTRLNSQ